MAGEIFKLERTSVRGANAANSNLSDNGYINRENAKAENWGFAAPQPQMRTISRLRKSQKLSTSPLIRSARLA